MEETGDGSFFESVALQSDDSLMESLEALDKKVVKHVQKG